MKGQLLATGVKLRRFEFPIERLRDAAHLDGLHQHFRLGRGKPVATRRRRAQDLQHGLARRLGEDYLGVVGGEAPGVGGAGALGGGGKRGSETKGHRDRQAGKRPSGGAHPSRVRLPTVHRHSSSIKLRPG